MKVIFPRHATKTYSLEYMDLIVYPPEIKGKYYLLDSIDNHMKCTALFHKADITPEILEKYKNRIIFITNNSITTDIMDNYEHFIIVSDQNNTNDIINILNKYDINILTRIFSGVYLPEDMKQERLFTILGIIFSYYPIDIYGFIFHHKTLLKNVTNYYLFYQYIKYVFKPVIMTLNDMVTPNTDLSRSIIYYTNNMKPDTTLYINDKFFHKN
jgi:hypothetical protein